MVLRNVCEYPYVCHYAFKFVQTYRMRRCFKYHIFHTLFIHQRQRGIHYYRIRRCQITVKSFVSHPYPVRTYYSAFLPRRIQYAPYKTTYRCLSVCSGNRYQFHFIGRIIIKILRNIRHCRTYVFYDNLHRICPGYVFLRHYRRRTALYGFFGKFMSVFFCPLDTEKKKIFPYLFGYVTQSFDLGRNVSVYLKYHDTVQ